MVADEAPLEAMVDQPCIAILAGDAEPAGPAQRERRIAAPVEKKQRLLATFDGGLDRFDEARRNEPPQRRALDAQIDRLNDRQALAAKPLRQRQPAIAATARID